MNDTSWKALSINTPQQFETWVWNIFLWRLKAFKLMKIVFEYAYQTSKDTKWELELELCFDVDLPEFDASLTNFCCHKILKTYITIEFNTRKCNLSYQILKCSSSKKNTKNKAFVWNEIVNDILIILSLKQNKSMQNLWSCARIKIVCQHNIIYTQPTST